MSEDASVDLSLISHTNAGKTTLTRTLLKRDVGEVRDAAHVTDLNEVYVMQRGADGSALRLWDTPGFGDTARLLRRLKQSGNAVGWVLTQVWDRYTDRPFWCSQQAILNVKEDGDVVLYLVNAAQAPGEAAYVALELEILAWLGKPVLLLLNQMGPPRPHREEAAEVEAWRAHVRAFPFVRDVLPLDAFARCWIQEGVLLDAIAAALPPGKKAVFDRLSEAWREENAEVFRAAMRVLAAQLVAAARDEQAVDEKSLAARLVERIVAAGREEPAAARQKAMAALAERLDGHIRAATGRLIALHGLRGQAAAEVLDRLKDAYASSEPVGEGYAALLGGFVTGALTGLKADIASGGLTFGAAALAGGVLGALGAGGLARAYNVIAGREQPTLRWSDEFVRGLVRSALLRYLAVAHYGRGRGDYAQSEHPAFWKDLVANVVERHRAQIDALVDAARQRDADVAWVTEETGQLVGECAEEVLAELYPSAAVRGALRGEE